MQERGTDAVSMDPVVDVDARLRAETRRAEALRERLVVVPLASMALMTAIGGLSATGLVLLGHPTLHPWLPLVLLTNAGVTLLLVKWARGGRRLAGELGVAVLEVCTLVTCLLTPDHIAVPIGAVVCTFSVATGTLVSGQRTWRWLLLTLPVWAILVFDAGGTGEDMFLLIVFPALMFTMLVALVGRVTESQELAQRATVSTLEALLEANQVLAEQREVARRANRAKSSFLASMSHELRTPLNAIIGYGELILEEPAETESEDVERIVGSGRHLLSLVDDLLDYSRIEAGRLELRPVDVVLDGFFTELGAMLRTLVHPGVELIWTCPEGLGSGTLDPTRVRQVVLNLGGNALKFTREGSVEVVVAADEEQIRVTVTDTGPGIPEEVQQRLFMPFVQGTTQGRKHEGTGLGLVISRRLVEAMGGDVSLSSVVGRGTTVVVTIPRVTSVPDAELETWDVTDV